MSDLNNTLLTIVLSICGGAFIVIGWFIAQFVIRGTNSIDEIKKTLSDIKIILSNHGIHIDNIIDDAKEVNRRLSNIEQRRRT